MEIVNSTNNIPERLVVQVWQHQLLDRTDLTTEDGEPIKIIYPGRINDNRGADLLDAVIATSRGFAKGDVEIHVKSSSWWAHRHHRDPNFNRVILHVVLWHNAIAATRLQNGEEVPTLALNRYTGIPHEKSGNNILPPTNLGMPCRKAAQRSNMDIIGEVLDIAGEERFSAKVGEFRAELNRMKASQSLYQGIMGALGYAKNKLPFLELAHRMPIEVLESISSKMSDAEFLARQQALLLGTAGLLPSQCSNWHTTNEDDRWIYTLEEIWDSSRLAEAMSEDDWRVFKVRPNNFPTRRIAAMSYLLLRYREKGILAAIAGKLMETMAEKGYRELEKALVVTTDGYWAGHFDFGLPSRLITPTLIGDRRAADIIVNVILPFAFAWGEFDCQPGLAGKALELYRRYPRLSVNTLERHMSNQLGLNSDSVSSARRQQGLIHIYKTRCSQGKCHVCPLAE